MHALHSGMSVRGYAESVGCSAGSIQKEREAAEVVGQCINVDTASISNQFVSLSVIHAAPCWLWPALVALA